MKQLMAWAYAPVFWCGFLGVGLWLVSAGLHWGLLAVFGLAVGVSFLAEWCLPYEVQWNRSLGDRRRDVAHAVVKRFQGQCHTVKGQFQGVLVEGPGFGVDHQHRVRGPEDGMRLLGGNK